MFIRINEYLKSFNTMDLHISKIYIMTREIMAMLHGAMNLSGCQSNLEAVYLTLRAARAV
jgi:hypothetical protein